jgi:hypothetical protein
VGPILIHGCNHTGEVVTWYDEASDAMDRSLLVLRCDWLQSKTKLRTEVRQAECSEDRNRKGGRMIVYEYKIALVNSDLPKLLEMLNISDNRRWRLRTRPQMGGLLRCWSASNPAMKWIDAVFVESVNYRSEFELRMIKSSSGVVTRTSSAFASWLGRRGRLSVSGAVVPLITPGSGCKRQTPT